MKFSEIINKLFENDDFRKSIEKKYGDQDSTNCKIEIEKKGVRVRASFDGNVLGIIITLKSVLNSLQKDNNISDEMLDELMNTAVHVED